MLKSLLHPVVPEKKKLVHWGNLHGAALGFAIAECSVTYDGLLLVIVDDPRQLHLLEQEVRFFLNKEAKDIPVAEFPGWECLPYDVFSPHQGLISERLRLLAKLPDMHRGVLLTSSENLVQRLPPIPYVLAHSFSIHVGDPFSLSAFRTNLTNAHYHAVSQVLSPGEYSVRGGIIDIFPTGSESPIRIELFDDEVDTIRFFDPDTQRSTEKTDRTEILPAREFPMTDEGRQTFRQAFRRIFAGDPRQQVVYKEVSDGNVTPGTEFFFPLFFHTTATLFDYLPGSCMCIHAHSLSDHIESHWAEICDRQETANHNPRRQTLPPEMLYLNPTELDACLQAYPRIIYHPTEVMDTDWQSPSQPCKELPVNPKLASPYRLFLDLLKTSEDRILIAVETPGRREAMEGMLRMNDIGFFSCHDFRAFMDDGRSPFLCVTDLERGLNLPGHGIQIITENQLYGERVYQRRRRSRGRNQDPATIFRSLSELVEGNPVVHEEHGVGRYRGLKTLEVAGEATEFLLIEYQNQDRLYVPVISLHLISRYVGGDPDTAPLHQLGSNKWEKIKKKAQEKAYDVATELLEVEALRQARKGHAMEWDQESYTTFTSRFPFEETPDQAQAIEEVIGDMVSPEPMDRLVCGDVGFGKTEVALRAAYIAVQNQKQVAILVPTTLLAQQHYQTFLDRYADLPITVGLLSRFRTAKDLKQVVDSMKSGTADIVIGTHILLQEKITFQDLGLLIIDEEHRFGVRQKEKIKQLRSQVDILTLTATPIPRTLNIALSSLRKISIIATPPVSRLSIKTFVREWSLGLIREACLREIRRGGQVYFVHNQVRTMHRIINELRDLLPEAEIHFGHGQMGETQLERIMQDFYHQRFNILVASAIIESGIDIPSANTIIINRADRFGLAQLHQLRGRVGRSHHQAYAYLLVPDMQYISGDARKRLDAISMMDDLGAGFALASHDLEIRGAGELLGESQSGSMNDVGFTLYSEYLRQAVSDIRNHSTPNSLGSPPLYSVIELHVPALLPESYLGSAHIRLVLYKRIASALSLPELEELQIEVIDRFGLLPVSGKNLFRLTAMRLQAERIGIRKLDVSEEGGSIEFQEQPNVDPSRILSLVRENPNQFQLSGPYGLCLKGELADPETRMNLCEKILDTLAPDSNS